MKTILGVLAYLLILTSPAFSQSKFSLQLDGGLISPISSNAGVSFNLQANYSINSTVNLYMYSGVSGWSRNKVVFWAYGRTNPSAIGFGVRNFNSYSEDSHLLIPFYIGSTFNFHLNKLVTPFLAIEIGYSYLSFYSFTNNKVVNPISGITEYFYPDKSTRKINRENLFGAGVGGGFTLPITGTMDVIVLIKLNSFVNNGYNGFLTTKGTYITYSTGLNYQL
jgi:hypothetical protein